MHARARVCFSRAYPSRSPRTAQREQQLRTARTRLPAVLPATSAIAQQRLTRSPTPPLLRTTEYPGVSTLREPPNEWVQSRTGSSPRAAAVADAAGGSGALRAAARRAARPRCGQRYARAHVHPMRACCTSLRASRLLCRFLELRRGRPSAGTPGRLRGCVRFRGLPAHVCTGCVHSCRNTHEAARQSALPHALAPRPTFLRRMLNHAVL